MSSERAERLGAVIPVPDLEAAVAFFGAALGLEPTFVDGDRWAQFDLGDQRVALAGADAPADVPGLMVKVRDVAAARDALVARGARAGPCERGGHEVRCSVEGPGGWPLILYSPLQG